MAAAFLETAAACRDVPARVGPDECLSAWVRGAGQKVLRAARLVRLDEEQMGVPLCRRTADASAGQVAGLPDGLAGRGCPELCQALVRGCRWALADVLILRAVPQARRAQPQPDEQPGAAFPFLVGRVAAAVHPAAVAAAQVASAEAEYWSVPQAQLQEGESE